MTSTTPRHEFDETTIIRHAGDLLRRNPVSALALSFLLVQTFVGLVAPWLAPYDPNATDLSSVSQPPNAAHWFGTDIVGRDILSRVITATRLDLTVAFSSVLISFAFGTFVGGAAAFFGGVVDRLVGRLTDVMMTFPLFIVAMGLAAAIGNSLQSVILASALVNLPYFVRLARAEIAQLRIQQFVEAARSGGNRDATILMQFMIPNALPTLVVQFSTCLGWAILNAASLSFIGLGIKPPTAEWGIMVADGAANILAGQWWLAIFPGLALTLTVLSFNLAGDGLRDILDVRTRK